MIYCRTIPVFYQFWKPLDATKRMILRAVTDFGRIANCCHII
jgi:hypothetical protein